MATHVAQPAGAEIPPAAPQRRHIGRMIGPIRGGAQPQVPVERRRHRRRVLRPLHALRPDRVRRPRVHLAHGADRAVPDPLADQADALAGMALVAHLRGHLRLAGGLGDLAGLVHRVRQGLLAVDVLARLDGHHGRDGMDMVRRRHHDGVDVLVLLLEHHPKVVVLRGVRELLERPGGLLRRSTSHRATMFSLLRFIRCRRRPGRRRRCRRC